MEYKQNTMDEALQKVNGMRADMGGTEILAPLKHIYSQPCIPSHPRQVDYRTHHCDSLHLLGVSKSSRQGLRVCERVCVCVCVG